MVTLNGTAIAIAAAMMAVVVSPAVSQPASNLVTISPASPSIQLSGTSGGKRNDGNCAGFIASSPNHTVNVTEDMNLRFVLQGAGQLALLIRTETGQNFCVPADNFSQGKIEIPGRWRKGTYSVFVGDRANESHTYTLIISSNK